MTRLYDRLAREGSTAFSYARHVGEADYLSEATLVVTDNVTRYFYERSGHNDWREGVEIPNVAPSFGTAFYETRRPQDVVDSKGQSIKDGLALPRAWGFLMRAEDLKEVYGSGSSWEPEAIADTNRELEKLGASPRLTSGVRWLIHCTLYVEGADWYPNFDRKDPVGPTAYVLLGVQKDGSLALMDDGNRLRITVSLMGGQDREFAAWVSHNAGFLLNPICLAMAFANCSKVRLVEETPPAPLSKKANKNYGRPLTTYRVLEFEPMRRVLEAEGRAGEEGLAKAFHLCKGYWRLYVPERGGPFGRKIDKPLLQYVGPYTKGSKEQGEVKKDYWVDPPEGGVPLENVAGPRVEAAR